MTGILMRWPSIRRRICELAEGVFYKFAALEIGFMEGFARASA